MGTGKTGSSIWAAEELINLGLIRKVLILATKSTMRSVWADELFKLVPYRSQVTVAGTHDQKVKLLKEDVIYYITNHDAIKTKAFNQHISDDDKFDLIIADEASVYRNPKSQLHKALFTLSRKKNKSGDTKRVWLMTGTPTPQGPEDAYGLARIMNEGSVPVSPALWRDKVMLQVAKYRWIPKNGAWDEVHKALQPAIRHRFEDCVDIPPTTYLNRFAPMTKEQNELVREVKATMAATLESGEQIVAANAGVQLLKILQILQGVVKIDSEKVLEVDTEPRIDVLIETIQQANKKFIVLAPFTAVLHKINKAIQDAGYKTVFVDGSVSEKERAARFGEVKHGSADGLVAQCQTVSHGLTLTEADTTIWYGPTFSTEQYLQANRRTSRPGQTSKTRVVHLYGSSLEEKVYSSLKSNALNQTALLELYREVAQGDEL